MELLWIATLDFVSFAACLYVSRALACSYPSDRYTIRLVRSVRAVEHSLMDPLHPKRF